MTKNLDRLRILMRSGSKWAPATPSEVLEQLAKLPLSSISHRER
jgi:hypothetical protein